VNQFHGRTEGQPGDRTQFVRPHDVEIVTAPINSLPGEAIAAEVEHVAFAGATVTATLKRLDDGSIVEAQLPRQQHLQLGLHRGQKVYVSVKESHTFDTDYSI
jgi:hypothetical protein